MMKRKIKNFFKYGIIFISFKANASQVVCRISGNTALDSLQVIKENGAYSVFLDGIMQAGFECIDRKSSSYFEGIVQCRNVFGDIFQIDNISRDPTDGYLKLKNRQRLSLACFEVDHDF